MENDDTLADEQKQKEVVAFEILRQLGGPKFRAMTGSYSFTYDNNSLSFKLRKNEGKYKGLTITLNGLDLYDIKFFRQKNAPSFEVTFEEINNVYAEDLQRIFTEKTGLDTHL